LLGTEPEILLRYRDPVTLASGYVVIDSQVPPVSYGGVRMRKGLSWTDLAMLARIGTLRYQLAGVPIGGARLGIDYPAEGRDSEDVLHRFLRAIAPFLESCLSLGPDADVPLDRLDRALAMCDLPWRMQAAQKAQKWESAAWATYVALLDLELWGEPFSTLQSAHSVACCTLELSEILLRRPPRVAVLGSGPFGIRIARVLTHLGASVVTLAVPAGGISEEKGLGPETMTREYWRQLRMSPEDVHLFITLEEALAAPVDVVVVASSATPITIDNVGQVKAAIVVEAAAGAVKTTSERVLNTTGKTVVPNFVATSGPVVIADSILHGRYHELHPLLDHVRDHVQRLVREVLRLSGALRISFREAAVRLALHRWENPYPLLPNTAARDSEPDRVEDL
jgi:glutamate dehydrogenase (NAD(P)+)